MLEDRALRRRHVRDPHRADDAVVVQLVANPERVGSGQRDGHAEHGRVGGVEDARRRTADEPARCAPRARRAARTCRR